MNPDNKPMKPAGPKKMPESRFMNWALAQVMTRADLSEVSNGWISISSFGDKDKIIVSTNYGRFDYDRTKGEAVERER